MTDTDKLLELMQQAVSGQKAELSVCQQRRQNTEFIDNFVGQGSQSRQITVRARVEHQGKLGVALGNSLTPSGLQQTLAQAKANALTSGQLFLAETTGHREMDLSFAATKEQTHAHRTDKLQSIFRVARQANLLARGHLMAAQGWYSIVNSAGLAEATEATLAKFRIAVTSPQGMGAGHGYACHRDADKLDLMGPFLEAAAKCQASESPSPLAAGKYTIILEPAAVADLMTVIAPCFNGRLFAQGLSPIRNLGEKIFGENFTLWDDGLDSTGLSVPFDFEGVTKQRINLVTKGVVENVALDNSTAAKLSAASTGHASAPGQFDGPLPTHLFIEPGNAMLDDMVASTRRGLLVSRLRNLVTLDSAYGRIAGATDNGTLLVEQGRLTQPLANLRFVQTVFDIFNGIEMIGDETRLFGDLWGGVRVPALKIKDFSVLGGNTRQN